MDPHQLAKVYTAKLDALLQSCSKAEKEANKDEKEKMYRTNHMRIDRILNNYFKRLTPAVEEVYKQQHNE